MDEFSLIVYFLRNPKTGWVKIGKAKDFDVRYKNLCREAGCELEILLVVYAEDTERQLHHYFSDTLAYKQEWFEYDERLKELIKATIESGHLVYPEGAPLRDLPVDMRREVKKKDKIIEQLSHKTGYLSNQLVQARTKRDEYKSLSGSSIYYKMIVENKRRAELHKEYTVFKSSVVMGTAMPVIHGILFTMLRHLPPSQLVQKLYPIVQFITALSVCVMFYQTYKMESKKRWWIGAISVVFALASLLSLAVIGYIYLFE